MIIICKMKKYKIKVIETLSRIVEVEADDLSSAIDNVNKMIRSEEIVLSAEDFDGRDIYPAGNYER